MLYAFILKSELPNSSKCLRTEFFSQNLLLLYVCMVQTIDIPVDLYDSPQEFVVIMPLGGVEKASIQLRIEGDELIVQGERKMPELKMTLVHTSGSCYRWGFSSRIKLPTSAAYDRIHSQLSPENILTIIVPKVMVPEKITVEVQ